MSNPTLAGYARGHTGPGDSFRTENAIYHTIILWPLEGKIVTGAQREDWDKYRVAQM